MSPIGALWTNLWTDAFALVTTQVCVDHCVDQLTQTSTLRTRAEVCVALIMRNGPEQRKRKGSLRKFASHCVTRRSVAQGSPYPPAKLGEGPLAPQHGNPILKIGGVS